MAPGRAALAEIGFLGICVAEDAGGAGGSLLDLAVVAEVCDRVAVFYAGEIVEQGPTAEVIANPRHPYTEALLRVASLGDWRRRDLEVIPGRPPEPGAMPAGCRFAARCAHATDTCATPVELSTLDDRQVRCHRAATLELVGA